MEASNIFPITVQYSDGHENEICDDMFDLASTIEFYADSDKPNVRFVGADGSALRVLVDRVEVVFCRRVSEAVDPARLRFAHCLSSDGRSGQAELYGDDVHRILFNDGVAEPIDPLGEPPSVELKGLAEVDPKSFHDQWIRGHYAGRTGDLFPMNRESGPGQEWPKHYTVGFTGARIIGGGQLRIDKGSVTLTPDSIVQRVDGVGAIAHAGLDITMVWSRLWPPWINVHLIVMDQHGTRALAGGTYFARHKWRTTLERAGFRVHEVRTLFNSGRYMAPVAEDVQ